jgi:hypothetical protein
MLRGDADPRLEFTMAAEVENERAELDSFRARAKNE